MHNSSKSTIKKSNSNIGILLMSILFFAIGAIYPFFMYSKTDDKILMDINIFVTDSIFALSIVSCKAYLDIAYAEKETSIYSKYLLYKVYSGLDNQKEKDIIKTMIDNNEQISDYFHVSKKQEKISYAISIACSISGFVILVIAIIEFIKGSKIEIAVITIISGALTEIVSGLILWIHGKSAEQLNFYYKSLHENEKFLSAITLADKIGGEEKKQMYMEIIKAQIRTVGIEEEK